MVESILSSYVCNILMPSWMDICVLSVWELKITACAQANIPRLLVMHMHIYIYIYIFLSQCMGRSKDSTGV